MQDKVEISVFLDTRRKKKSGTYPLKLRVYHSATQKTKFYSTKFSFSAKEFEGIWESRKLREELKRTRKKIEALIEKAEDALDELAYFSFDQFEKLMFRKAGNGDSVFFQYELYIQSLKENNQLGTASNYELSLKSLKKCIERYSGKEPSQLSFYEITPEFLEKYERFMINDLQRSRTTVSMYLRALRTIFNNAITKKAISQDVYPFGDPNKGSYKIPAVKNVKKALNYDQMKQLFHSEPQTPEQAKAKDFWFFSYACNGLNIKDIALLRYENIQGDQIVLYRAKTLNTSKGDLKPIVIDLTDVSISIINKYGNRNKSPKNLVFSIVTEEMTEVEKHTKIKNFTRFINQNFKKYASSVGVKVNISTYWARHTFATHAIRSGATMEFVSEALNHSNMATTQAYFAGFSSESKKDFMKRMTKFD